MLKINKPLFPYASQENYNISSQAFEILPSSEVYTMSTAAKSVHVKKVPITEVESILNPTLPDPEGTRKRRLMYYNDQSLICDSRVI